MHPRIEVFFFEAVKYSKDNTAMTAICIKVRLSDRFSNNQGRVQAILETVIYDHHVGNSGSTTSISKYA